MRESERERLYKVCAQTKNKEHFVECEKTNQGQPEAGNIENSPLKVSFEPFLRCGELIIEE
jgi:hypothetical protein